MSLVACVGVDPKRIDLIRSNKTRPFQVRRIHEWPPTPFYKLHSSICVLQAFGPFATMDESISSKSEKVEIGENADDPLLVKDEMEQNEKSRKNADVSDDTNSAPQLKRLLGIEL